MIEVSSLSKRYGNFLAVDDVSFSIKKGEVVGFLGPNGAGKSTIMNIVTSVYLCGSVCRNREDCRKETRKRRPWLRRRNQEQKGF